MKYKLKFVNKFINTLKLKRSLTSRKTKVLGTHSSQAYICIQVGKHINDNKKGK